MRPWWLATGLKSFNPHSPLLANELPSADASAMSMSCFNPHSPLLANEFLPGRKAVVAVKPVSIHIRHCWRMNWRGRGGGAWRTSVSIHIRHCWRMNYYMRNNTLLLSAGFNPHSPLLANEFGHGSRLGCEQVVSIHIRHCWRMNCNVVKSLIAYVIVSIHIRHCWRMNSFMPASSVETSEGFNPHSPLLANELVVMVPHRRTLSGFNPHSPLLANELLDWIADDFGQLVSIHIRHCWRMN